DDPEREIRHLELLLERRVDGLIVASSRVTRRHAARLRRLPIPIVLVNTTAGTGVPAVLTANRRGGAMAARHLVELGHRRIGYIGAPAEHPAVLLRQRGVADALPAGSFPIVVTGDGGVDGGEAAVDALLREAATGIVGFNDLTAIGALRGLRRAGAAVPADVSVVGFDDIEMASWTDPPLTTVRQPTDQLGSWAVARLVDALHGAVPSRERLLLEPELVVRGSTGPPRGSAEAG
ncbi:MAG TPA: substrate-binding domain-containing protein, partial [Candidatus Limnocylindria bacterium]|nr:substrate-binding domain-containing protein [Candidatus Limnocylindria bacterium]